MCIWPKNCQISAAPVTNFKRTGIFQVKGDKFNICGLATVLLERSSPSLASQLPRPISIEFITTKPRSRLAGSEHNVWEQSFWLQSQLRPRPWKFNFGWVPGDEVWFDAVAQDSVAVCALAQSRRAHAEVRPVRQQQQPPRGPSLHRSFHHGT